MLHIRFTIRKNSICNAMRCIDIFTTVSWLLWLRSKHIYMHTSLVKKSHRMEIRRTLGPGNSTQTSSPCSFPFKLRLHILIWFLRVAWEIFSFIREAAIAYCQLMAPLYFMDLQYNDIAFSTLILAFIDNCGSYKNGCALARTRTIRHIFYFIFIFFFTCFIGRATYYE